MTMLRKLIFLMGVVLLLDGRIEISGAQGFSAEAPKATSPVSKSPMHEYLKFGGSTPNFDVLAKTKEYVETDDSFDTDGSSGRGRSDIYHEDYVLRGPVIGPLVRKDFEDTGTGFDIPAAFPDLKIERFGFTIDPENPYRCFWFERWRGTNTGDLANGRFKATGNEVETPPAVFCTVWTPDQKIIYQQVGAVVDRHEGNTRGKAAVFGLLHAAGVELDAQPGNRLLRLIQRLAHKFDKSGGRSFSREEDIPKWWVSKSRGADKTEQW